MSFNAAKTLTLAVILHLSKQLVFFSCFNFTVRGTYLERNMPINELDLPHFGFMVAELFKQKHPCEGWFNSVNTLSMGQDQSQVFLALSCGVQTPLRVIICWGFRAPGDRVGGRGKGCAEMESTPVPLTVDAQWIWKVMWCFLAIDSIGLDSAT